MRMLHKSNVRIGYVKKMGCVSHSFRRALGSHSRGQGFDSPYLHHELWEYHHDTPSFLIVSFVLYFLKDKSEFR